MQINVLQCSKQQHPTVSNPWILHATACMHGAAVARRSSYHSVLYYLTKNNKNKKTARSRARAGSRRSLKRAGSLSRLVRDRHITNDSGVSSDPAI